MDKQFWVSVIRNEYAVPVGYTILPLIDELFSFIRSTDPELRDLIGLEVFFHWLDRGLYSLEDIRRFICGGFLHQMAFFWQRDDRPAVEHSA